MKNKMKIAFLSTYSMPCGIAGYTLNLVTNLKPLGIECVILGNMPYTNKVEDSVKEFFEGDKIQKGE